MTAERLAVVRRLAAMARERGQSLAQLALAWVLRHAGMSSVLIGASRLSQIDEAVAVPSQSALRDDELQAIEDILASATGG